MLAAKSCGRPIILSVVDTIQVMNIIVHVAKEAFASFYPTQIVRMFYALVVAHWNVIGFFGFTWRKKLILFLKPYRFLHFAPEYAIRNQVQLYSNIEYITTDIAMEDVNLHMDIMDLLFRDSSFDVIMCSHVLEHVDNDLVAMRELHRILKPSGWALLQVPLDPNLETTKEDPSITSPVQRKQLFGQEDHVRLYGRDFCFQT